MLEKNLRICSVSNSLSEIDLEISGLNKNNVFVTCMDMKAIKKLCNTSDFTFPSSGKNHTFIIPLSDKEFAEIGSPSVGATISLKISLLSESV